MDINVFQAFVKNNVHGQPWPQVSCAVTMYRRYPCGHINTFMARRINKKIHAEEAIISYLESLLMKKTLWPPKITLFLNASPCHRCSQQIINFLDIARQQHGVDLLIEVVFSTFYRVRRPSCEQNPACSGHLPSYLHHKSQVAGLTKLYLTEGIVLRTFQSEDWQDLGYCLHVPNYDFSNREKEDNLIRKDFEQLFGPVFTITTIIFFHWTESPTVLYTAKSPRAITSGQSPRATKAGQSPKAITSGQSPTVLTAAKATNAGQSPKAITSGQSPTVLTAAKATNAGQTPKAITSGQSPKATNSGRSPTSVSGSQSFAANADQPSSITFCFLSILAAFLGWILVQYLYALDMIPPR